MKKKGREKKRKIVWIIRRIVESRLGAQGRIVWAIDQIRGEACSMQFFSNAQLKINMHTQSEGSSVQREIFEHSASKCEKTSQKPSQVCGVNSSNGGNRAVDIQDGSRGMITPAAHQKYTCGNRCQKIRRLVKEFQRKRQIQLGLKQRRDYSDNDSQQNSKGQLDDARPSIERLFGISSTSESSAFEFGTDKSDGVHTNGGYSERNSNGRMKPDG